MSSHNHLPPLVRELVTKSNLFSLIDFARISNLTAEECAEILAAFVASGVLRLTRTEDGDVYYWLVKDPDEKQASPDAVVLA
jgi:hypothetical protein